MQIGKVSAQTCKSIDAIRFYEKHRLLDRPLRSEGGFRLFHAENVERIQFIRRAQQLGFSLPEISELLVLAREDGEACSHMRELLQAKVAVVRNKIGELRLLDEQLTRRRLKCERKLVSSARNGRCPVLEEIARGGSDEN